MYCICCKNNKVKPYDGFNNMENTPEEDSIWMKHPKEYKDVVAGSKYKTIDNINVMDGIIQRISAGYGSKHDTDVFIIAICDECITKELSDGVLLYGGNYMHPDDDFTKKEIDKSKQTYRRRKNLDGLV